MEEFPGNSYFSKAQNADSPFEEPDKTEPVVRQKIVEGKVTVNKKSLGSRFKDVFTGGTESFADHLVENVIIPTFKELVMTMILQSSDGFRQIVEQKMFGQVRHQPPRPGSHSGPIPYNRYHQPSSASRFRDSAPAYQPRRSNVLRDIIVEHREEADEVLLAMETICERQGHATVGDLYGFVGEHSVSTDEKWGWVNFEGHAVAVRGGYLLVLPRPAPVGR